ncbi:hypothetical protein [Agathobacter rectalis]|uniref:hypothetical protein n=1 Tax=Agathobacter rectalis TaxID=39491 RepID=UPI0027D34E61|nr:hypothetical protein [Agathobacter rectalis]
MRRSKSYEVRDPMNIWNKYDFAMSGLGKKSKILAKIKHFFKCVKWSKQRITRGYCDCDVWEMFSFLQTLIPDMLQTLKDSIKLWQQDYENIYKLLGDAYRKSEDYFGSVCKTIAKKLHLYDIYGVDSVNRVICGNTILCQYYSPFFSYTGNNREYIKSMTEIGGRYTRLFNAMSEYHVNTDFKFDVQDYGGFIKSPVGNVYSDRFVLLSILSQINFLLYCVDQWIKDEIPTKLRLGYLLYFSLLNVNEQINTKLGITFKIDTSWKSDRFRNAMAHYKLGIVLKENELISGDAMFGLTRKLFGEDYLIVKKSIYKELKGLAKQIGEYLELPQRMVYLQ